MITVITKDKMVFYTNGEKIKILKHLKEKSKSSGKEIIFVERKDN